MSTTKKLSEKLDDGIYFELSVADKSAMAAEARALEERVAEFNGIWAINQQQLDAAYADASAATARAEAAEAKLQKVRAMLEAGPECSDARCYISRAIFEVLDGEGFDETDV